MLFNEIIAVYSQNHTEPINTKSSVIIKTGRGIYLPLGFKAGVLNLFCTMEPFDSLVKPMDPFSE
jgi:hypothetical protein